MVVKKRKNSRAKGSRGERALAKEFEDWWGASFARTPSSGGFATHQFRSDWNAAGDLVTPDTTFPFCVECKWVEDWEFAQLWNDSCIILKWWEQTLRECPSDKLPLLVFKKNGHPLYAMMDTEDLPDDYDALNVKKMIFEHPDQPVFNNKVRFSIFLLKDFFRISPAIWKTKKDDLVKYRVESLDVNKLKN